MKSIYQDPLFKIKVTKTGYKITISNLLMALMGTAFVKTTSPTDPQNE